MGTAYCGSLKIFGNQNVEVIITEAYNRLCLVKGKKSHFNVDEIKLVFMGSATIEASRSIGCRDLVLEHFVKNSSSSEMQYEIFFSTDSGYPDYFATYLVEHLRILDPKVKIVLDCKGDSGEKVKETFTYK